MGRDARIVALLQKLRPVRVEQTHYHRSGWRRTLSVVFVLRKIRRHLFVSFAATQRDSATAEYLALAFDEFK